MSITCVQTLKSFSLGVDKVLWDEWAYRNGMWRKQKSGFRDTKWFEDYNYGVAETLHILQCWLSYLPGAESWNDYGDFTVTFDMGEVAAAGWSEYHLRSVLSSMSWEVRMIPCLHAQEPWNTHSLDRWGNKVYRHRHPAIEPLDGMIDNDSPYDLETL